MSLSEMEQISKVNPSMLHICVEKSKKGNLNFQYHDTYVLQSALKICINFVPLWGAQSIFQQLQGKN